MSKPDTDAMSDLEETSHQEAPSTAAAAAAAAPAASASAGGKKKAKKKKKSKGIASGGQSDPMETDAKSAEDLEAEAWLANLKEEDVLNSRLLEPAYIDSLREQFHLGQPFKHLAIRDLLDPSFLRTLENELRSLDYFQKSNDLFEFAQSSDLKSVDRPLVNKLKEILYGKRFREILATITGIELTELEHSTDMSANVYGDTNTLLCHDDELLGRRIAYILYLVPPSWSVEDGGTLDLFATDEHGQPSTIAKSLVPAWNTFTFFEVSPVSFHQVSEVLTNEVDEDSGENRVRISISGWFHGAPIERPAPYIEPQPAQVPLKATQFTLDDWLAPDYRKTKNLTKIASQFSDESSIQLAGFLAKDKYERLMAALNETSEWAPVGPANKRKFEKFNALTDVTSMPASVVAAAAASSSSSSSASEYLSALHTFFQSRVFGEFLAQATGMTYLSSAGGVRKFTAGSYTLAHSEDAERFEEAVDVCFSCLAPIPTGAAGKQAPRWDTSAVGGSTHYIEEGVEEELMAVEPAPNTLSIIYRAGIPPGPDRDEAAANGTGGVIKFVKYINHHAQQPKFDFDYTFRVEAGESDEEESEEEEPKPAAKGKKSK